MLWTLTPLFVTAISFFDGDMAMFNGRSPNGKLSPTGVKLHPFGKCTRFDSSASFDCADTIWQQSSNKKRIRFLIGVN
jgi:hypothetical protein